MVQREFSAIKYRESGMANSLVWILVPLRVSGLGGRLDLLILPGWGMSFFMPKGTDNSPLFTSKNYFKSIISVVILHRRE